GGVARPDRRAARAGIYRFGSALAATWRALHLCDDENFSVAVRARHAAAAAGFRGARRCRAAVEGEAAGWRHHAGVFRRRETPSRHGERRLSSRARTDRLGLEGVRSNRTCSATPRAWPR